MICIKFRSFSNPKLEQVPSGYKAKLLDHEIYVKHIYFYYEVKGWAILTHYPKYHFNTSNHLQDIWQNHWTMKQTSQ